MTLHRADSGVGNGLVSPGARAKLSIFVELLVKWNKHINLVSPSTLATVWTRHIEDSVQLFDFCPIGARNWVDIGSGGGFPGMVIAILAADSGGPEVTLVESDQRKAAFLQVVSRETGVPVNLATTRIEDLAPMGADVLSARAVAPLPILCGFASRHLATTGTALFMKGAKAQPEIEAAKQDWRFSLKSHPSRTDAMAVILEMRDFSHV